MSHRWPAATKQLGRADGRVALSHVDHVTRVAPVRYQLLCHEMPHHWWPVAGGRLCLRCSDYANTPRRPRDEDARWKGARGQWHR